MISKATYVILIIIVVSPRVLFLQNFLNIILDKYDYLMLSNYIQLGFKKHSSCSHAIFVLRQVAGFCVTHVSNVYMAALDAKKAFDRVHHLKLNVLSDGNIPFIIIKVIVNWYSKMFASVRWNGAFSNMLPIKSCVLQGSILSPSLFNLC